MKIENGKIIEVTYNELYAHWLKDDWCEIMSFPEYKWRFKDLGGIVLEDDEHDAIV